MDITANRPWFYSVILMVIGGLVLGGCAAPPRIDTPDAELIIADPSLRGKVSLSGPSYRTDGPNRQAQVVAQNDTGKGIIVEYQFQWMDASGFILPEDRMWHSATLSPYGRANLTSTATTADGRKIRFSIRRPYQEF